MSKPASASDGTQGKATHKPRHVPQVMVSSTFTDLHEHRQALIGLLNYYKLHPNVMEYDSAGFDDVIDSSLNMVRDSAAYILIVGPKYGQTPNCPERNPDKLSITELEFNEAARLGRPTLLFVMGEDHPVKQKDVEKEPEKITKLNAFRERAKPITPDSGVHRVYSVFNSLGEFKDEIAGSISKLQKLLEPQNPEPSQPTPAPVRQQTYRGRVIPAPPVFYAEPDYIGSHTFVGREAQLQELNDWAKAADPTNLLLYEAIGGNGKSMLTWEWTTKHATTARSDWAGRFWYSFYERGAVMADFCRRALAYMTGRPMEELEKMKTLELGDDLLACLHERPWLLILDGLERVLVAYHRIDAAEVPDEEANAPTDKILNRNPCDAIREEDSDLLRRLAAAAPSKILVSSRLTPRALLNPSGQSIPGAKRFALPGLRPADAEQLLRSCGITGNSEKIQEYLSQNCDNHPLVIGVLAGLITNYLRDRGNFDTWVADSTSQGGAYLDLAKLDLVKKRNHILKTAFEALPDKSRQLLSTLALISSSVDYETLSAFNPHMPPEPERVEKPAPPEYHKDWELIGYWQKKEAKEKYKAEQYRRRKYEHAIRIWRQNSKIHETLEKLTDTVKDIEQRGMLQYNSSYQLYDLHPVVRGVATSLIKKNEANQYGQRVIDYFSSLSHQPYIQASSLDDVSTGLQVVQTLLRLQRFEEAADAYQGDLAEALVFSLEAYEDILALLHPFFPFGWNELPKIAYWRTTPLINYAAIALAEKGEIETAISAYSAAILLELNQEAWRTVDGLLNNISYYLPSQNLLAKSSRIIFLNHSLSDIIKIKEDELFLNMLLIFNFQTIIGNWNEAEFTWQQLEPMVHSCPGHYRQGQAEYLFALNRFKQGLLQITHILSAEKIARAGNNRFTLRNICILRGNWLLEQGEWSLSAVSFHDAITMARERGLCDEESETGLALAKLHLGQFHSPDEARHEAERLSGLRKPARRYLAMLWREIGDLEQAKKYALAAYKWAWADGEPYVNRYELDKTTELLRELNMPVPDLPPYDPAKDEPFPWEADVRKAIEKLRVEKAAKQTAEET